MKAIDDAICDREYILGDFSAADIMVGYCFILVEKFTTILDRGYSNANEYWRRLKRRPAAHILSEDFDH